MSASTNCKNCGNPLHGKFCSECGQPADTYAINAAYFLHDIPHSILHVDKGLWFTLKELFTRPGFALKEYLAGKRIQHFKPFGYVLIMSTICTLLVKVVEYLMLGVYVKYHPGPAPIIEHHFFEKYISVLIFILIPILSLVTWLCFRKKPFNYWEHFLVNTYLTAQLNVILLIMKIYALIKMLFTHEFVSVNFMVFMGIFMFYYGFVFSRLMRPVKKRLNMILNLALMNFILAFIYITAFSMTGIMEPWWKVV